jgi:uncharacterized membrane protein YkoI
MKSITPLIIALGALAATAAAAAPSVTLAAFKGQELVDQAKITPAQARAIASKARPGRVVDEELEKEPGGSGLRYAFDIVSHGRTHEVGVDASTGRVIENAVETAAQEAQEAQAEAAAPAR